MLVSKTYFSLACYEGPIHLIYNVKLYNCEPTCVYVYDITGVTLVILKCFSFFHT